ncbi:MAG: hypothetical protein NZ874_03815 [Fimbriimonadales bacterium]|nr:hypothetical protein [Fimbriimonadales bacterium]
MSEIIFLVSPSAEGGYEARALGHSIFTEADDLDTLRRQIQDAIACHFEPSERPRLVRLHIVHEEVLPVEAPA